MYSEVLNLSRDGSYTFKFHFDVGSDEEKGTWAVRDSRLILTSKKRGEMIKKWPSQFQILTLDGDLALSAIEPETEAHPEDSVMRIFKPERKKKANQSSELKRSAKDEEVRESFLIVAGSYLALWSATWFCAPSALHHQMLSEAKPEWQRFHDERERSRKEYPEFARPSSDMAFDAGPVVEVKMLVCPFAIFFRAETKRIVGGLNGAGAEGWFFYTPWRVYDIAVSGTWVS